MKDFDEKYLESVFFYKGICFIGMLEIDIERKPFVWDGKSYPTGSKFARLGDNPRQSLCIGWNLIYEGQILNYVLFSHDAPKSKTDHLKKKAFYCYPLLRR
ncbi:hypothetical protein [Pedobacter sp. NJ-S-72]